MNRISELTITNASFGFALLIIISLGIYLYISVHQEVENKRFEKLSSQILLTSKETLSNLKDAETGMRGFIITGNEDYLEPFYISLDRSSALMAKFKELYSNSPAQLEKISKIELLSNKKFLFIKQAIATRREGGFSAVLPLINTNQGKILMDDIRTIFYQLDAQQDKILKLRENATISAIAEIKGILILGVSSSIIILIVIYNALQRQIIGRRKREDDLFIKNEWFTQTLISLGDGFVATDTNGIITLINDAASNLTGWSKQDAIGKHIDLVFQISNEDLNLRVLNPALEAIRLNQAVFLPYKTILTRKDKDKIFIDDSGAPIHDKSGEIIGAVLVFRDITEKVKAENERDLFFDMSLDMLGVANHEGYFTRINTSFEKTLGYNGTEITSQPFMNLVHPDDVESTLEAFKSLTEGLPIHSFTNRYRCSNGNYKTLEWTTFPFEGNFYAIARDITIRQQEKAEIIAINEVLEKSVKERTEELIRQTKFMENLLNNIPIDIAVYDEHFKYIFVNPEAIKNEAVREWIIGKDDLEYCKLKDIDDFLAKTRISAFKKVKKTKTSHKWIDKHLMKDGQIKHILRTLHPIVDNNKLVTIGCGVDITSLKIAELQKETYINALEEMMFMTSHKVRHSVTQILGIRNLVEGHIESEDELKEIIQLLKEPIDTLDLFTRELTMYIHDLKEKNKAAIAI